MILRSDLYYFLKVGNLCRIPFPRRPDTIRNSLLSALSPLRRRGEESITANCCPEKPFRPAVVSRRVLTICPLSASPPRATQKITQYTRWPRAVSRRVRNWNREGRRVLSYLFAFVHTLSNRHSQFIRSKKFKIYLERVRCIIKLCKKYAADEEIGNWRKWISNFVQVACSHDKGMIEGSRVGGNGYCFFDYFMSCLAKKNISTAKYD